MMKQGCGAVEGAAMTPLLLQHDSISDRCLLQQLWPSARCNFYRTSPTSNFFIDRMSWFGNKRVDELKAAFDGARISRTKESLLYTQCKEIIDDPSFKAPTGPEKDLCIFRFNFGESSFAIGASSRGSVSHACIVIHGKLQIGHNLVDIKINCTQNFPTDAPQVYFSHSGSNSFTMFPFAILPPPSGSQHWNFCTGTTLVKLLRAMQQYNGPLPFSNPTVMPVPVIPVTPPVAPPSGFSYVQPEISRTIIGQTFDEESPMKNWMKDPNGARPPAPGQASQSQSGWPVFPINSGNPSHQQQHHVQPQQQHDYDGVPTPPIIGVQLPVPPSGTPGPPPPRPNGWITAPEPQHRAIYGMGFDLNDVQRALQEAQQDENRAIDILLRHGQPPRVPVEPPRHVERPYEPLPPSPMCSYMLSTTSMRAVPSGSPPPPGAYPPPPGHPSDSQHQQRWHPPPGLPSYPGAPSASTYLPPPCYPPHAIVPPPFYNGAPPPPPGHPSDPHHASSVAPPRYPGPPAGPPTRVEPPLPAAPSATAVRQFTIVLVLDNCEFPMSVTASNSTTLFEAIKSHLGDIVWPEVDVAGKWVSLRDVRFEDLPSSEQSSINIRTPPAFHVAPVPDSNRRVDPTPPAGVSPQQRYSPPPPARSADNIAAHASYPLVKSAEIQFDIDSQGQKIELGRGVFKAVYKGKYFGTPVAVRSCIRVRWLTFCFLTSPQINMLLEESASENDKQEFLRECNVLSNLRHGNIIGLLGACTDSKKCFLLTELMDNGTLFSVLHEKQIRLTQTQRQNIVLGMLMGMNNMHMRHVYHRDLKSANILIDGHFTPKIADFGFAKQKSAAKAKELFQSKVRPLSTLLPQQSSFFVALCHMAFQVGTPLWMAPEVLLGQEYDPEKADVWSVGMLVFEVLAGKVPFATPGLHATTEAQLCQMIQQNKRPPLDGIHPQVAAMLQRCWSINPALRPTISQMLEEYQQIVQ